MTAARWLAGDPALRPALLAAARGEGGSLEAPAARGEGGSLEAPGARGEGDALEAPGARVSLVRDKPGRRRAWRVELASGEALFAKESLGAEARHAWRERAKAALRLANGDREWRTLAHLAREGVPVPEPRGLVALPGGRRLLALRHVAGRTLGRAIPRDRKERSRLLVALGEVVARMHAAGVVHRDLHHGNVLVGERDVVLIDFQAARRTRSARARRRDLGDLDASLAPFLSLADRVRLRAAVLGLRRPFDADARRQLRAVGRASAARERNHARSRTRRSLRPGRLYARLSFGRMGGLRRRETPEPALLAALAAGLAAPGTTAPAGARAELLKEGRRARVVAVEAAGRHFVVKVWDAGGPWRGLADVVRGSPARRTWRAGHGLAARRLGAATPHGFVEERRTGLVSRSAVVLEDLRPWASAEHCAPDVAGPGALSATLARLASDLHRRGVVHGDLKASHVFVGRRDGRLAARLIDLEGTRFPRRVSDARRIRELAELNASIPEERLPTPLRRRAFERYAAALPFRMPTAEARRRIVAQSLARGHRWRGPARAREEDR